MPDRSSTSLRLRVEESLTPDEIDTAVRHARGRLLPILRRAGIPLRSLFTATRLAKAVAAHPSHVVQRTAQGQPLPDYRWRREHPRDVRGRYVRRLTPEETAEAGRQAEVSRSQFERALGWVYRDCRAQRLTMGEAVARGNVVIAEYYERLMRAGMQSAGNPAILLSVRDRTVLARIVADEQDFWAGFMKDVTHGTGVIDYDQRFSYYINAGKESVWLGWVLGDMRPKRRIFWHTNPSKEHCRSCAEMEAKSPFTPERFLMVALAQGYLPNSGSLDCKGIACGCVLSEDFAE